MAVPEDRFYPFGPSSSDTVVSGLSDDASESYPLDLSHSFVFFGTSYNQIHVSV